MENSALQAKNKELEAENAALKFRLNQLERLIFGTRSERFVPSVAPEQLRLNFEGEQDQAVPEEVNITTVKKLIEISLKKREKKQAKRLPIPAHLPRVDIIIEPEQDVTGWKKMGAAITEELDYTPATFQVNRYIRPKYVRPKDTASQSTDAAATLEEKQTPPTGPIVIAPMPERPIPKGIPSAGLLAHILISKFIDHLPYYRQQQQFVRIGMSIKTSTINGWVAKTCLFLEVLYHKLEAQIFAQSYLMADETKIKVITEAKAARNNGGKGKSHTGYFWVYYDPFSKQVLFKYDPGRGRKYPAQHLKNFSGHLQTDGYTVYDAFDLLQGVSLNGCLAHVRRKFEEAKDNDEQRASEVLKQIQQLYLLEEYAKLEKYTFEQRHEFRQQHAAPLMTELKQYLDTAIDQADVFPKSPIGKAIAYALNRWTYLKRYLDDGRFEIDNNLVENAIRPVALGRRNYLFVGSPEAAHWAAILYSLLGSAKQHDLNPFEYLKEVIQRIPATPMSQVEQLLPQNWTPV